MGVTAIFGGTFNPPHIGHYEMLEALQKSDDVDKILLIPTRIPPHKICDFLADDRDRIDMCSALISDFDKAELCLTEFSREGKSYTYDTVKCLEKLYPETKFSFVCGGDMLMSFDTWYRYDELMKLLPFIIFRRADIDEKAFDEKTEEFHRQGMRITVMDGVITAVSSSYIRSNIDACSALMPKSVYRLIKGRGIYNA